MTAEGRRRGDTAALRQQAEEIARADAAQSAGDLAAPSLEETRLTLHELQVHQIELEMQNEELRRAQAELDAARARFFDLYDLAPVGYVTISEPGLILEANLTAATLLGVARGALVQQRLGLFIRKEDEDLYYLHRKQVIATGETQACELRMVRPDGTVFWAHLTATAARDADGAPVARFAISDVTARQQAESALRASEDRYRRLFTEMMSGFALHEIVRDASGKPVDYVTLEVNAAFQKLLGVAREAVVGQRASSFMGQEELAHWLDIFGPVALTGTSASYTMYSPVNQKHFEGNAYCHEQGRFAVTFTDVTERVRAEQILQVRLHLAEFAATHTMAELLTATLDETEGLTGSTVGFYHFLSADQRTPSLQAWSTRSTRELGQAEGKGRHYDVAEASVWVDCVHQRRPVIHNDYAALPHQTGFPDGHAPVLRDLAVPVFRDGRIVAILGVGNKPTPYVDADIEIVSLLADVAWDLAGRKQAEAEKEALQAQLLEMQKLESVGRLAGGVAHDFNNTFQAVLLAVDLVLARIGDPSARQYLLDIKHGVQRSADLTAQLLAFARKQRTAPRVLYLNEAIVGLVPLLQRLVGEDIALQLVPGYDAGPVRIDPSQIQQILTNLADNARNAISGAGRITIETANVELDATFCAKHSGLAPGAYTRLAVSDDGAGMTRDVQAHLFEPFYSSRPFGERTGLGLAAVYGIVRQNGGAIEVASEPGRGATITIWLPRLVVDAAFAREETSEPPPSGGTETILLVDDEPSIIASASELLSGMGYTVLPAERPTAALSLAERHPGPIHLVIADVVMPEMSGRELVERLVAVRPAVKRLFVSGHTAAAVGQRGVATEGTQFLSKPFTLQTLAQRIREVLDQP